MTTALSKAEAYLAEQELLAAPGAVLYSSEETLASGPVYLLGLNPGGDGSSTLADSIRASRAGHNCYLDEQWAPGGRLQPKGKATLQRRVQDLCRRMGRDTRLVPASNLAFTRSVRIGAHENFEAAVQHCFPVHQIFLDAIEPDFLMTFGSIDNFSKIGGIVELEGISAEHGAWRAHRGKVHVEGRSIRFGNIPHMSLWASDKRPAVMDWVLSDFGYRQ